MDTGADVLDSIVGMPRAGFWRRWFATLIDWIVVALPFQVIAVVLFTATAGHVQMNGGFFRYCDVTKTVPQDLSPPPPHDSNFAQTCNASLFGLQTGSTLIVGRITKEGHTTTNVNQAYMLDRDGHPIAGTSIDGLVELVFIAYLIGMIWRTGRSLGSRVAKVRVVDASRPSSVGVPLGKVIVRYLAMGSGAVPALAILMYRSIAEGGSADAVFTPSTFQWLMYSLVLCAVWVIILVIQVARKRDPIYDKLAGTAVLKD